MRMITGSKKEDGEGMEGDLLVEVEALTSQTGAGNPTCFQRFRSSLGCSAASAPEEPREERKPFEQTSENGTTAWIKQNYPDSPFETDAEAIGQLLQTYVEAHVKNPYCEDDLYPFPHNAYSFKGKPEEKTKEEDKRKEQEDPGPS
ncbi:Hypp4001 [Branchiostoma lanceolatum]|uniref:Hypp4001 protein n=1 Tax=Branchiostoma lanceolatum TaxID=7740 RepID=A0A8K0A7F3_BRALA|nr:Hypp4001 [Branchiostoma lanceolatum]